MENNLDKILELYNSDEIKSKMSRFKNQVEDFFKHNHKLKSNTPPTIHTIKSRFKSEESLIDKLNRKKLEGKIINSENFTNEITDLVGVRILHIYLEQFPLIHNEIMSQIDNDEWELYEAPKAYSWDDDAINLYKQLSIQTIKKEQYTSVHYVIRIKNKDDRPIFCEIQIRTLFEEAWGEIDHIINYPHKTSSIACKEQLKNLSSIVMTSRGMIDSLLKSHKEYLENVNPQQESGIKKEYSKSVHNKVANSINKTITEQEKKSEKQYSDFYKYSDYSLADSNFPLFESDTLTQIISNLKIHNWYIQNPAIELLLEQDLNILEENQDNNDKLFVIGRNIYQSACGDANLSIDLINNLKQYFTKYSDYVINNIYSGIIYEIFFDSNNNFRENTKSRFIDNIFELESLDRLEKSIVFIKESLKSFEERLFILPNSVPQSVTLNLNTEIKNINNEFQNENVYEIISLKIDNEELIVNENKAPIINIFDNYNDLINKLSHLYTVPKNKFNLSLNDLNMNLKLYIPYEKGLYKK